MATSTSFRISETAKRRLASRAVEEGTSATALLERLIVEGIEQLDHPGIVFRGPVHDRRAALAAGPDVWEIIARLQELDGSEELRISTLSAESELPPRLIRIALNYAAEHADDIKQRIDRNRATGLPEDSSDPSDTPRCITFWHSIVTFSNSFDLTGKQR